jgi:DNA primase
MKIQNQDLNDTSSANDFELNKSLAEYFNSKLSSDDASYVRDYIYTRGISDDVIEMFKIGWCPSDWKGVNKWNRRLMIPLIDTHNNFISFHTRIITDKIKDVYGNDYIIEKNTNRIIKELFLDGTKKEYDKVWYHGSFEKSCFLYGMNVTKEYISDLNYSIVVEGIFDALILFEKGIKNVVATLGTALTDHQLCLLKRYGDFVIFMFDSDDGGKKALLNAKSKSFLNSKSFILPDGFDPHDFVMKYGIEDIKEGIKDIVIEFNK